MATHCVTIRCETVYTPHRPSQSSYPTEIKLKIAVGEYPWEIVGLYTERRVSDLVPKGLMKFTLLIDTTEINIERACTQ